MDRFMAAINNSILSTTSYANKIIKKPDFHFLGLSANKVVSKVATNEAKPQ